MHTPALSVGDMLALVDGLPVSVALWDADLRLRYGNHRALERFGRPLGQLRGASLFDLVQPHAVELSTQYIEGALAGRPQQVERAMVDPAGQRYNAHQVTHVPNVVDGAVQGYCALAVDITASIEGYEQARRAREQAALRAVRARIAGDIGNQHVVDDLSLALERLDAALERAADALPDLRTAAAAIDRAIDELRATVPSRPHGEPHVDELLAAFPAMSPSVESLPAAASAGVRWPEDVTGRDWSAEDVCALLDLLPAEVAVWDASLRNVFANRAARDSFRRRDVVGRHALELLGVDLFRAVNIAYIESALRGEPQPLDRTVAHPTGLRHLQLYCAAQAHTDWVYTLAVDVSRRVEAELALQDARAAVASARQRERVADDLHKLVIQPLFAAGQAATSATPTLASQQVRSIQDGIVGALEDLEAALSALHEDVVLLDVLPSLARLVYDAARPRDIAVRIETVGSVEYLPPAVGAELLAVAEAAMSNVALHSRARNVVVTVAADASAVWLRVVDDGRGVGGAPRGTGWSDMALRAARLGGTCRWRPNAPTGTILDWRVPTVA